MGDRRGSARPAFLLLAALAYPGGMGMGDVKLALLMGVALGRTVAVALPLGMLVALVPAIFLFARHGSGARKMAIPFAPFLALGSVVALFAGDALSTPTRASSEARGVGDMPHEPPDLRPLRAVEEREDTAAAPVRRGRHSQRAGRAASPT